MAPSTATTETQTMNAKTSNTNAPVGLLAVRPCCVTATSGRCARECLPDLIS